MSKDTLKFPDQTLVVNLTSAEQQVLEHAKKHYKRQSNSGAFRSMLRDVAKDLGIEVPKKKARKKR